MRVTICEFHEKYNFSANVHISSNKEKEKKIEKKRERHTHSGKYNCERIYLYLNR